MCCPGFPPMGLEQASQKSECGAPDGDKRHYCATGSVQAGAWVPDRLARSTLRRRVRFPLSPPTEFVNHQYFTIASYIAADS